MNSSQIHEVTVQVQGMKPAIAVKIKMSCGCSITIHQTCLTQKSHDATSSRKSGNSSYICLRSINCIKKCSLTNYMNHGNHLKGMPSLRILSITITFPHLITETVFYNCLFWLLLMFFLWWDIYREELRGKISVPWVDEEYLLQTSVFDAKKPTVLQHKERNKSWLNRETFSVSANKDTMFMLKEHF